MTSENTEVAQRNPNSDTAQTPGTFFHYHDLVYALRWFDHRLIAPSQLRTPSKAYNL